MSALFTATHPQRSRALVLMGTFARQSRAPDYPFGASDEDLRARLAVLEEDDWAAATTRNWLARMAPAILRRPGGAALVHVLRAARCEPRREQGDPADERRDRHPRPPAHDQRADARALPRRRVLPRAVAVHGRAHPGRASWSSCRATTTCRGRATAARCSTRSSDSSAALGDDVEPDRVLATLLFTAHRKGRRRWRPRQERAARAVRPGRPRPGRALSRTRGGSTAMRVWSRPSTALPVPSAAPRRSSASVRGLGLEVRAGVHTGEIERSDDERARNRRSTSERASPRSPARGEVLVSSTVKDIVAGSGIPFAERGEHNLAGVPGTWRLFAAAP